MVRTSRYSIDEVSYVSLNCKAQEEVLSRTCLRLCMQVLCRAARSAQATLSTLLGNVVSKSHVLYSYTPGAASPPTPRWYGMVWYGMVWSAHGPVPVLPWPALLGALLVQPVPSLNDGRHEVVGSVAPPVVVHIRA